MSSEQKASLSFWVDLLFKVSTAFGVAAIFFLKSSFASHEEVAQVGKRVADVESAIRVMVEQNKVNDRQDDQLRDHESRLRTVEKR